jgi:hypothetical protein
MEKLYQGLSQLRALGRRRPVAIASKRCGACRHFRNDPAYLEAAIPGLKCLSSGAASVRADDGLCLRHDRYLSAGRSCADFASSALAHSI